MMKKNAKIFKEKLTVVRNRSLIRSGSLVGRRRHFYNKLIKNVIITSYKNVASIAKKQASLNKTNFVMIKTNNKMVEVSVTDVDKYISNHRFHSLNKRGTYKVIITNYNTVIVEILNSSLPIIPHDEDNRTKDNQAKK